MLHTTLEIFHIVPLAAMVVYTLFIGAKYFATGKVALSKYTRANILVLSTVGIIGHLLQPVHFHFIEPCVVYVLIMVAVIAEVFARRFVR